MKASGRLKTQLTSVNMHQACQLRQLEGGRRLSHNTKTLGIGASVQEKETGDCILVYVCNFTLTMLVLLQCNDIVINSVLTVYSQKVSVCPFRVIFERHVGIQVGFAGIQSLSPPPPPIKKYLTFYSGSQQK